MVTTFKRPVQAREGLQNTENFHGKKTQFFCEHPVCGFCFSFLFFLIIKVLLFDAFCNDNYCAFEYHQQAEVCTFVELFACMYVYVR